MAEELTKEQKKALRKEKFKKALKYIGIGLGIATVSGGAAYLIGKNQGMKSAFKIDTMKDLVKTSKTDGAQKFVDTIYTTIKKPNGHMATEITDAKTNEIKYINYNLTDTAPDWWDKPGVIIEKTSELVNE